MAELFKKVACFTDIHYGLKNNSRTHNQDCENFLHWFVKQAQAEGCETCIFLGDWHNNRSAVNVSTLNYTTSALHHLSKNFDKVYLIIGNHDLYYREKREIHSLPFGIHLPNVIPVNDILTIGETSIIPWLVGDEWRAMRKLDSRYVFGHFELPRFKMNAMVEMPDHGGLNAEHFPNQEMVFSGHFHKRQQKGNIHYIGNAFPHNYADAWDDERGMMILEWGGEPKYIAWPNAPKYRLLDLSHVVEDPSKYFDDTVHARITVDVDLSYEEANYLKETFQQTYKAREISLIPAKKDEHAHEWQGGDIKFESVDQIVMSQLTAIDSEVIDKNLLINIYNGLTY